MNKIYTSIDQLIGNTPLLHLQATEKKMGLSARLLAKLEFFNPCQRPGCAFYDPGRRGTGYPEGRLCHHRAYLRKYRHWTILRGRIPRI